MLLSGLSCLVMSFRTIHATVRCPRWSPIWRNPLPINLLWCDTTMSWPSSMRWAMFSIVCWAKPSIHVSMEQGWFYSLRSVLFNCFIEVFISVARDFVEAPSQMLENWYGSPFAFRLITVLYSIPLLGVGNLRFSRKCRVITRQRSHSLKSSFRKSFRGDCYCQNFQVDELIFWNILFNLKSLCQHWTFLSSTTVLC